MIRLNVDLVDVQFPTIIGENIVENLEDHLHNCGATGPYFFLCDEFVYNHYGLSTVLKAMTADFQVFLVPAQKNNKTFYGAMRIFEELDRKNIPRNATLVAIGGGVIGDMGAFVASCWYRGISLVHIPTTLLSAVDSCLGGKAAINFRDTVNAVGAYHHPVAILIDTKILMGLPDRELNSGFGEIIKYSMLTRSPLDDLVSKSIRQQPQNLGKIISNCLEHKISFVSGDIEERNNRLFLNFGHTIGHAVEFATVFNGKEFFRHGEGVALGMKAICEIGRLLGKTPKQDCDLLESLLISHSLPTSISANQFGVTKEELETKILELVWKDKKRLDSTLRLILLAGRGNPVLYHTADEALIRSGIRKILV